MIGHQSHSEDSGGDYEDEAAMPDGQWQSQHQDSLPSAASRGTHPSSPAQGLRSTAPTQKRRRVTRACDECRRKKIKCDGRQPCNHCTVYTYDCTFDQPSNRKRNPAPQYVEALEHRLQRAEILLKTVLPDANLDDPNFDLGAAQRLNSSLKTEIETPQPGQLRPWIPLEKPEQAPVAETDPMLESMVENTGSMDLDDEGNWDFHGHSSGRVFLRRMRTQFGDLMGKSESLPFMKYKQLQPTVESPKPLADVPMDPRLPKTHDLPRKECALLLSGNALDDAGAILRLVHQPTYYAMLHRVYDIPYEEFSDDEFKFLPLVYGVIALGALFGRAEQSELQTNGYSNAIEQGYHWHRISRQMVDITDCRDLISLQVLLFMILFLQSSARLSTCYSYIGIALRSAIRMGLHRSVSISFNPVERELRKRIFWIVRKLDIYVGALLGLPQMLSNDDIDQEMPMEVDDEYITLERVLPMPPGKISIFASFNAHTRLVEILAKTVKYIYPIKVNERLRGRKTQSYVVSHAKIREIEQDLQAWMEALPTPFRPGEETSSEFMRIRHLLRMAYAHIQMFLYRPFLHYASQQTSQEKHIDRRSYACAAACVSVSRNIVHLTGEMKRRGLLVGSYWFYMYTTFFAIISLIFYVLENSQSSSVQEILQDAYEGKDTLAALAAKSLAADRCSRTLADIFDQLPSKLRVARNSGTPQQRQAPASYIDSQPVSQHHAPNATIGATAHVSENDALPGSHALPAEQGFWDRTPVSGGPSKSYREPAVSVDPSHRRNSRDNQSSLDTFRSGMQMPDSSSPLFPLSAAHSSSNTQNGFVTQSVPDLTAMMFPSSDPFAYPNQPMTTLENKNFARQENHMSPSALNIPAMTPNSTNDQYTNVEAQMFGQMPPYILPGQQNTYGLGVDSPLDASRGDMTTSSMAMQGINAGVLGQQGQARPGQQQGVNYDQLFGEDWGGWMNYRQ